MAKETKTKPMGSRHTAPDEETKKALVQQQAAGLPAELDLEADAGAGTEQVGARDVAMPFLGLLQQMSPQLDRTSGKRIEGAEAGTLFNTLTNELLGEEVLVVPCYFEPTLIEWIPREKGGGIANVYSDDDPIAKSAKRKEGSGAEVLPNGNDLVRTAQHYCLLVDPETGAFQRIMVSLSSTGLKKSRLWNSLMLNIQLPRKTGGTFNPASFSHLYKLRVVPEKNNKGSYFNLQPELVGPVSDPALYAEAKRFSELVKNGSIRAKPERDEAAEAAGHAGGGENLTKPEPGTLNQGKRPY